MERCVVTTGVQEGISCSSDDFFFFLLPQMSFYLWGFVFLFFFPFFLLLGYNLGFFSYVSHASICLLHAPRISRYVIFFPFLFPSFLFFWPWGGGLFALYLFFFSLFFLFPLCFCFYFFIFCFLSPFCIDWVMSAMPCYFFPFSDIAEARWLGAKARRVFLLNSYIILGSSLDS